MNLSRRNLLLGAVAVGVTPVVAPFVPTQPPLMWVPNTLAYPVEINGEIFYGGAAGGGKMYVSSMSPLARALQAMRQSKPVPFQIIDEASEIGVERVKEMMKLAQKADDE